MKLRLSSHNRPTRKAVAPCAIVAVLAVALLTLLIQSRRRSTTTLTHARQARWAVLDTNLAAQYEVAYRPQRTAAADLVARTQL